MRGRIQRRLALALVLTALTPVLAGIWLSRSLVRQSSDRFFVPEIGARLEQSLELYGELASSVKASMRSKALALSLSAGLSAALESRDAERLLSVLRGQLSADEGLVSLEALSADETPVARVDRGRPVDPLRELQLRVSTPVLSPRDAEIIGELVTVFAHERARFDEMEDMSRFVHAYEQIAARREADEATYLYAFAALLGITIIAAVGVGGALARGVSNRVSRLAAATKRVGAGDFSLHVRVGGNDEISDLARAFNQMVREVETNRSRIEYLQRLAAWQGMARRLAHEIKNPLTPIQLAVQELHMRYRGDDESYRNLVETTREIVETEVGTLRRLVSEFSNFARLPKAELTEDDLFQFLRDQRDQLRVIDSAQADADPADRLADNVDLRFEVPDGLAPARLDRQMFRRALVNLVNNAAQACGRDGVSGRVVVSAEQGENGGLRLYVDDNGPGVAEDHRSTLFDPYVTHTPGGTGLGLAIVKKIVIEHGGRVEIQDSPLGGTRMAVELPRGGPATVARQP